MAHKKGGGSTKNGRDSNAQMRGIKKYGPWFDPPLETHDGAFLTPRGPGVGIQDVGAVLEGAEVIG